MLKERQWLWFSLSFAVACLTKWQPLIIAPFVLLYIHGIYQARQVKYTALLGKVVLPAAVLIALIVVVFGPRPIFLAFYVALTHQFLSGNALNLNWIVTHLLQLWDANLYGGVFRKAALDGRAQLKPARLTAA
jgi:hypothetical protein